MTCKILKASGGQFFVRVVASNGQTLAHSEQYVNKRDAANCAAIMSGGGTVQDLT